MLKVMRTAAAGLVILLALTLGACGGDEDRGDDEPTTTTTTSTTEVPPSSTPSTTTTTVPAAEVVATVDAWLTALVDGDLDRVWGLTAAPSRRAVGSQEAFEDWAIPLAEGWAAWGRAENRDMAVVPVQAGSSTVSVVVLTGTVAQEGPPAPSSAALPVRDGGVDPFVELGSVEFQPPPGTTVMPGVAFEAYVLVGRDVQFVLDGHSAAPPTSTEGADGDQQRLTWRPESIDAGRHTLTVVVTTDDGDVMVRTAEYTVS